MDIVKKIIYFAVGIIMTVGFIVMGMSMYNKSKDTIHSATAQYDSLMGRYDDIAYALYDGAGNTASGAEVREVISKLTDENITVYVKNGSFLKSAHKEDIGVAFNCSEEKSCGYDDKTVSFSEAKKNMTDRSKSLYYINPSATFDADVKRDENGLICALSFIQK